MGTNITTEHFAIAAYEKSVFAAADFYIPYEISRPRLDRSVQIKQFKSELCAAIRELRPRDGEVLFAQYAEDGGTDRFFDLENMLFYNLGASAFADCAAHGISFSALPDKAALCREVGIGERAHGYAYQCLPLTEVASRFDGLPPLAEWNGVPLDPREAGTLKKYWKALRRAGDRVAAFGCLEPAGCFALRIELRLPRPVRLASAIKPLLDGVVCAFHGADERCRDCLTEFCRRERCEELAVSHTFPAVLGEREVIRPYRGGQSFLWNPADDQCRLALVTASYGGETSSFSGKIYRL